MVESSDMFLVSFLKTAVIRASTYLNGCESWIKKLKQTNKNKHEEPDSKQP